MASFRPIFNNFISLLLLHLGCFFLTSNPHHHHHSNKQKNDASLLSHSSPSLKHKTTKALSSSWSFLKRIMTRKPTTTQTHPNPDSSTTTPPPSSSLVCLLSPDSLESDPPELKRPSTSTRPEPDISSHQQFHPLRNDIYPCPSCGEIFLKPNLLGNHQTVKHAVSELHDSDSGKNIVRIIFNTGWPGKIDKTPNIIKVLKIHNSPKILARFEEHRESVKLNGAVRGRDERCVADGNELLRFHCATFVCDLGQDGNSGACGQQYCGACGIITCGFSRKAHGIGTWSTGWRAHAAVPEEVEREFGFMGVKRAVLVCRVIAGRVGRDGGYVGKEDSGYDSVVPVEKDDDELLVFNPRAVLPCFVIVYAV